MNKQVQIVIVGGGPSGLAAAIAAYDAGCKDILVLERDSELGGILNQCIHNGFGLHTFKEELTGPEYAGRYEDEFHKRGIAYKLNTMVLGIEESAREEKAKEDAAEKSGCIVTAMNREDGLLSIEAGAVILCMGCRERPRGALNTPGTRPAGIYSAGTAQRFVNREGFLPGKEVVILGSGDIGLIMARRMTLEGARVKLVAELMPYSGGLKRNIVQCLDDYNIPLRLSTTVVDIIGKDRVEAVVIAGVDENRKPIPGTEETIPCDTLLLSCGLIPENDLIAKLPITMQGVTGGPKVDDHYETSIPGIFACGNTLHVHDLVDYVSKESALAGKAAAQYVLGEQTSDSAQTVSVQTEGGVRYCIPCEVHVPLKETVELKFRVANVYRDRFVSLYVNDVRIQHLKKRILSPGEMEVLMLMPQQCKDPGKIEKIRICLEEE